MVSGSKYGSSDIAGGVMVITTGVHGVFVVGGWVGAWSVRVGWVASMGYAISGAII